MTGSRPVALATTCSHCVSAACTSPSEGATAQFPPSSTSTAGGSVSASRGSTPRKCRTCSSGGRQNVKK
jgi:hypothetical protein